MMKPSGPLLVEALSSDNKIDVAAGASFVTTTTVLAVLSGVRNATAFKNGQPAVMQSSSSACERISPVRAS